MENIYSDGQGTFLYATKCEDDSNFVNLRIEEEQSDNSYLNLTISLYKDDIICLSKDLESFISEQVEHAKSMTEYIVTVAYWPMVMGKNEVFKTKTNLSKEDLHDRILNQRQSENEYFEIDVIVETVDEYLKGMPIVELK